MTATSIPTMIIDNVELRARPSILTSQRDSFECDHVWEPHQWETGRAHCPRCGSFARWLNDPRAMEEAAS